MLPYDQMRARMHANAERIRLLAEGVSAEQARWRPDPASWSLLEVINHLYDEEREDFRVRLNLILHHPAGPWPPIDPKGWVTARGYNQRDLAESLANFLAERRKSLEWLESLGEPDWEAKVEDPRGALRAGDMFAAWVAHDGLHLRQLTELHYLYLRERSQPYEVGYAGAW
jgi:DinB superfamily